MKIKGAVSINRSSNDIVRIEVEDVDAHVSFVVAEMSLEAFASAVTGMGCVKATLNVRGLDRIGTRHEHKEEVVPCEWSPKDKAAVLASYEVDGWIARESDLGNYHRRTSNPDGYRVTFTRNVKKEE